MTTDESFPDTHHDPYSNTVFGFWLFLLSDFILFGALFAVYAVLHTHTFGGLPERELLNLPFTLSQTLVLLTTSFVVGLAGACAHRNNKSATIGLFLFTFVLGIVFLGMQLFEFHHLIETGNSWTRSGFLSAFFTLTGTFAAHVIFGLIWIVALIIPIFYEGISKTSLRRLTCLKMFWQFLNVIWIFIYSMVYLMEANI